MSLGQPRGDEPVGEFVQIDGVIESAGSAYDELAAGAVEVFEEEAALVVDGCQGQAEIVADGGEPVEGACQLVGGQWFGQGLGDGDGDAAGGIAED